MDKPKTSLADQYIKQTGNYAMDRKVKYVDSLYSDKFLNDYFNSHQLSNKRS
jgi:hypothetical protein